MATKRVMAEIAASYAPFTYAVLQGLGDGPLSPLPAGVWPKGRTYWSTAHFRAPYDEFGYLQDNTLQGLGAPPGTLPSAIASNAPPQVKRFILSGEPVPTLRRDATLPFNQIPRWLYAVGAVGALAVSYVSYKKFKKAHPK